MAYSNYFHGLCQRRPVAIPNMNVSPDGFFVSQFTSINPQFTLINHHHDLGILNDEVFAIAIAFVGTTISFTSEQLAIIYLTTNPLLPIIRDLVIAKKGVFEGEANNERNLIMQLYPAYYRNLRYPISEGKLLKKMIMSDTGMDKRTAKHYIDILEDSMYDDAYNDAMSNSTYSDDSWAFALEESQGYKEFANNNIK